MTAPLTPIDGLTDQQAADFIALADDQPPPTVAKVTISTPGVSVHVEAAEPLEVVADRAEQIHRAAHDRCGNLPAGFGGAL